MFCIKCGQQLDENAKFCFKCGEKTLAQANVNASDSYQPTYTQPKANVQTDNIQQMKSTAQIDPSKPIPSWLNPDGTYKMGWYKFIINFSIWITVIINATYASLYASGSIYSGNADIVYDVFSSMKGLDIFYALANIALAVLAIYTRFRLANFKKNGPSMLYMMYIVGAAVSLIYLIVCMGIVNSTSGLSEKGLDNLNETLASSVASTLVSPVVGLIINITYFKHRKELFCN